MKKLLQHCQIKPGRRYKVVTKPFYWGPENYPNLGKVGVALWVNISHGVNLSFDGKYERIIKPECLEEVIDEKEKETKKVEVGFHTVKKGTRYKIIKIPAFWPPENHYPDLNRIGKAYQIYPGGCLLHFEKVDEQRFVSFDCMEEMPPPELEDDYLIKQILANPTGALKIVKGLVKMNKDPRLKMFLEQGVM